MNELQPIFDKPKLSIKWDYRESVNKAKGLIFKWKNVTEELFNELWVAREKLPKVGRNWNKSSNKTWSGYCQDIGSSRQVINRWLRNWEELKKRAESPPLPRLLFTVIYADPPFRH